MDAKAGARERFDTIRDSMIALSHRIHANPELGFEEEKSSTWLVETLSDAGFTVEKGICELPTAFIARAGKGPLHIAICAEYDCLPGIGHACGHNIIAASAVGAAIAAARVADEVGLTISVIGTPAEEVGDAGGKILLLERGAFTGMHAAMMVHPAPADIVEFPIIAASMFDVRILVKRRMRLRFPNWDQCCRCVDHRADSDWTAAATHSLHRSHPRYYHQRWGRTEHRPGSYRCQVYGPG